MWESRRRRGDLILAVSVQIRLPQALVLLKVLGDFNLDRIRPPTLACILEHISSFRRFEFVDTSELDLSKWHLLYL